MKTPCEEKKKWLESGRMGWREQSSAQKALRNSDYQEVRRPLIKELSRGNYGQQRNK